MNKQSGLYQSNSGVRIAETDVFVGQKMHFKTNEHINNRCGELNFDAWVDDISDVEKEVYLYISFSFSGSRRREAFWIRDVFSHRITLCPNEDSSFPKKEEYDFQVTLGMLPKAFEVVNAQLDSHGLVSHKDAFDRQMTQVLSYDLERAFKLWHEDEKNGFLGVDEMSAGEAIEYMPTIFANATFPKLSMEDYQNMFKDAKRVFLCEVSPEGYAEDIIRRMRYAVDSLGHDSKDVFYYVEVGEKSEGFLTPDGSAILNDMERHYNVVKHIWGCNPDGVTRYNKVYVGVIVRKS